MTKNRPVGALGLLAAMLILASCSGQGTAPTAAVTAGPTPVFTTAHSASAATPKPQQSAEPMEITLAIWDLAMPAGENTASQAVYDEIASRFGIHIIPWEITWDDWQERIDTAAAGGTLPDFFACDLGEDKINIMLWSQERVIRDIPLSMWTQYPTLYIVMEWASRYQAMSDGKMYFIPRTNRAFDQTGGQSVALFCRIDWASYLGYDVNAQITWDQFIALLYSYARSDPDRNNSLDTRGLTLSGEKLGYLYDVFMMTFGVRDWVLQNGEWIPGLMSDRAKEALKWMNQLYRDGVIDPDYNSQTVDNAYIKFASGQAAMLAADGQRTGAGIVRAYWEIYNPTTNIMDRVALLPQPVSPYGVSYNEPDTPGTGTLVSAQVDDEKLSRALALFEWLFTREGLVFMRYGREGTDYEMADQGAVSLITDENGNSVFFAQAAAGMSPLAHLSTWNNEGLPGMEPEHVFDTTCQQRLENLWWVNNWRRMMFTDAMYTPEISTFSLREVAEDKLAYMMMMSTDIDTDWETYIETCMREYNTQAVIDEVNEYARKKDYRTEE